MRAVSSTDIWAVGVQQGSRGNSPLIVHWNGASWSVVHNPAEKQNAELFSVVPIGDTYVWAAGYINSGPLIEHFNGRQWVIDYAYIPPTQSILQAITGTSLSNIWAGGYGSGGPGAMIERWDRSTWRWYRSPTRIGNYVISMSARSSSEVWAVGPSGPGSGGLFVERWDGSKWKQVPYPRGGDSYVYQVDATASNGYTWFVGNNWGSSQVTAFVDRYREDFRDMRVLQVGSYQTILGPVSPVPNSSDVWVVGRYADVPSTAHNLAERYTCTPTATGVQASR